MYFYCKIWFIWIFFSIWRFFRTKLFAFLGTLLYLGFKSLNFSIVIVISKLNSLCQTVTISEEVFFFAILIWKWSSCKWITIHFIYGTDWFVSGGLPMGPDKTALEKVLMSLSEDRYRVVPNCEFFAVFDLFIWLNWFYDFVFSDQDWKSFQSSFTILLMKGTLKSSWSC